jgi:hypothetical protein
LICKILYATLFLKGYGDSGSSFPMFQTGTGKSVLVSESSVQKARAVLEEEGDTNKGINYLACMSNFTGCFCVQQLYRLSSVNISNFSI